MTGVARAGLSRREFVFGRRENRELDLAPKRSPGDSRDEGWIRVGRVADFPPGFNGELSGIRVRSLPEGIQIIGGDGEPRATRIERDGFVSYSPAERWPEGSALSVLSGSRIVLEDGVENVLRGDTK